MTAFTYRGVPVPLDPTAFKHGEDLGAALHPILLGIDAALGVTPGPELTIAEFVERAYYKRLNTGTWLH